MLKNDKTFLNTTILSIRKEILICIALVIATIVTYWPVKTYDFIFTYDDTEYVLQNPQVQRGITAKGVVWAFTTFHAANWHPLTWLSHMLDVQIYGMDPGQHHMVNVLIHIANSLLLFGVLRRMSGHIWRSALVSALFALHPLHVESVAMIAERKDVLCTLLWLLTIWFYHRYTEHLSFKWYLAVVVCFSLGLMAKPMVVTLPFVLLLLDCWPLNRISLTPREKVSWSAIRSSAIHLIQEKIPLFFLTAVVCVITVLAQQSKSAIVTVLYPLMHRLSNAMISYINYIVKMFWPYSLAVFYPYRETLSAWQAAGASAVLVIITGMVLLKLRKQPYLAVGWFWYLGTLVPVIGLVQVGGQAMADRYTYIPLIGIFIMIAWGAFDLLNNRRLMKGIIVAALIIYCAVLMVLARVQVGYWSSSSSLFQHTLEATEKNWLAHTNLGNALSREGKKYTAISHYLKALQIHPHYANAHYNLGVVSDELGHTMEAIDHYRETLRIYPEHVGALNNLGGLLIEQGKFAEGIRFCQKALRIDPSFLNAYKNLAVALSVTGKLDQAIVYLRKALDLESDNAQIHLFLGRLLAKKGSVSEAKYHFKAALRFDPKNSKAYTEMGDFLLRTANYSEAEIYYSAAIRLAPDDARLFNNLGVATIRSGKFKDAILYFQEALRLEPNHANARNNLRKALTDQRRLDEAIARVRESLKSTPDDATLQLQLGDLYQKQGELVRAMEFYRKALIINPALTPALSRLANAQAYRGENEAALSTFERLVQLEPENAEAYYNLARLFARLDRIEDSITYLKKAIEMGFDDWEMIKTDVNLKNIRRTSEYLSLIKNK